VSRIIRHLRQPLHAHLAITPVASRPARGIWQARLARHNGALFKGNHLKISFKFFVKT
jgi:hypothetical protein